MDLDTWITGSDSDYFDDGPSPENVDTNGNPVRVEYRPCSVCTCRVARYPGECHECGTWHSRGGA